MRIGLQMKRRISFIIIAVIIASITAVPLGGYAASKGYKLSDIKKVELVPNRQALSVGDTTSISLNGILTDGSKVDLTMGKVDYVSTDESVVKISREYGLILLTAVSTGEAYILASFTYNEKTISASYKIMVVKSLNSKTRTTFYTTQRVQTARNNIANYKWADTVKNTAVSQANRYLKLSYDQLRDLVTPQSIPRSYAVNQKFGCLNCGKEIDAFGVYPYITDAVNNPFKLECPNCHMKFPTNDFKSYYDSGKNKQGIFEQKRANKAFLVNKLYPEKGSKWGVDDGYGFVDGYGRRFNFIAYYNHWGLWYRGAISKALNSLRDAYVYTGEPAYARAGIILLDKIADVYPAMDISRYNTVYGFKNSDGGTNTGKAVGCIWENEIAKDLLKAYDAFFPAMEDTETVTYIRMKAALEGTKRKRTAAEIKKNIEDGIVRQIFPAVQKAQIRGNNGMHQSTLALAAVVLDMLPETRKWLDFVFKAGTVSKDKVTGGNILATLVDDVDRDGNGNEASPQYNKLWLSNFIEIADILDGYDLYPAADLYKNVKFKKMFYAMHALILGDSHSALIGDSGATGSPVHWLDKNLYVKAFQKYKDPVLAQVLYFMNNNKFDAIKGDIFSPDPENVMNEVKKIVNENGTLKMNSANSAGYGFAVLRSGNGAIDFRLPSEKATDTGTKTQRSVSMYYGRNYGHGHSDTLNLGINAFGLDLTPDLGYPEYADESPNRMEWVRNTISHNTVVVDEYRQENQIVGRLRHFDDTELVKLMDIEAPDVYLQTSQYRRTAAMIKVDAENSYVVDFFRVKGGNDHYYSFHGAEGDVVVKGLDLVKQADQKNISIGTYAGPEVDFGERPENDSVAGFNYIGGGFHWLDNVLRTRMENTTSAEIILSGAKTSSTTPASIQTPSPQQLKAATTPSAFSVDWNVKDTWNVLGKGRGANTDVHLKLTMVGNYGDVSICDGKPPRNNSKNPKTLKYLIVHNQGENLESIYNAVIEPYKGQDLIQSVAQAAVTMNGIPAQGTLVSAIKVTLRNGRTDYIISSTDTGNTYLVDGKISFRGSFGVYCEKDGKPYKSYMNDSAIMGDRLITGNARFSGTISDFTRALSDVNEIKATMDGGAGIAPDDIAGLVGRHLYVDNERGRNAVYLIKGVKTMENGILAFDVGDVTTISSFQDANNFSKGYVYDISAGDRFSIPLSRTWSAE